MEDTARLTGIYGISSPGGRESNEDALLAVRIRDAILLAVADGLGGHAAGDVASRTAVEVLRDVVSREYHPEMGVEEIRALLRLTHLRVHEMIKKRATGERAGMATTLVSVMIQGDNAVIANTGDSRAYILSDEIRFMTRDHSVVRDLIDRGEITMEEAETHPLRHVITHSLGNDPATDTCVQRLRKGDTLLLSSDGLHDSIDEGVLVRCVASGDPEVAARHLMRRALLHSQDNITVIIYRV